MISDLQAGKGSVPRRQEGTGPDARPPRHRPFDGRAGHDEAAKHVPGPLLLVVLEQDLFIQRFDGRDIEFFLLAPKRHLGPKAAVPAQESVEGVMPRVIHQLADVLHAQDIIAGLDVHGNECAAPGMTPAPARVYDLAEAALALFLPDDDEPAGRLAARDLANLEKVLDGPQSFGDKVLLLTPLVMDAALDALVPRSHVPVAAGAVLLFADLSLLHLVSNPFKSSPANRSTPFLSRSSNICSS